MANVLVSKVGNANNGALLDGPRNLLVFAKLNTAYFKALLGIFLENGLAVVFFFSSASSFSTFAK